MTVSTTTTKNSYSANGTLHSFAYGFKIFADADLTVIVRSATGTETTKTLNTHYVVTNAGTDSGGNVLFKYNTGSPSDAHYSTTDYRPASGETVVILRTLTKSQGTDYVENDPFPSTSHEDALDRLTFITQELQEEIDRTIKLSKTNTMTSPEFTTSAADRASKILSFDSSGELSVTQELGTFKGNWAASTAYVIRDIVKDTSTNNIFIAVTAHTSSGSEPLTTNTDSAKWSLIVDAASATTASTTATTQAGIATTQAGIATTKAAEALSSKNDAETAKTASETAKSASESARDAAQTAQAAAETALDTFTDRFLGAKSSDPTVDNDGNALIDGALYFDTTNDIMKVYDLTNTQWRQLTLTSANQTNVNTVAGQISPTNNIATVAGANSNITAVAGSIANVNTTASNISNVNSVAGNESNINSAVSNESNINAVVSNASNINSVAGNATNINSVAGSITNVNTVATNLASVNNFADVYRIASSAPTSSLDIGDLYFDTTSDTLKVYGASGWQSAGSSINGTSQRYHYDITGTPTSVTGADANGNTLSYDAGYVDVYVNGVRMSQADVTVTSGDTVTFASALSNGDEVDIVGYGTFAVASLNADNLDSGTVPDARITGAYTGITNLTMSGNLTVDTSTLYVDSANNRVGVGTVSPSDDFEIITSADAKGLTIKNSGNVRPYLNFDSNRTSAGNNLSQINFKWNTTDVARIIAVAGADTTNKDDGHLAFSTASAGSPNEAMRIDSSGNLLVGKTSADNGGTVGAELNTNDTAYFTRSGGAGVNINRTTSDGNIALFQKDGTTVGSIGAEGGQLYILTGDTGLKFASGVDAVVPVNANGANRDGAIDIGVSSVRFKDLYLSGNAGVGANPSSFNGGANNLVVGTGSGSEGISIYAGNSSNSAIFFADTDSTTTGQINYQHASNAFTFHTNGGTERMRIDSSGNLLVGKTSASLNTTGIYVLNGGATGITRSASTPLAINRLSNDGDLIHLFKDDTLVGSIGNTGTVLKINGVSSGFYVGGTNAVIYPQTDNTHNLGTPNLRFEHLYLGGGVYLGGTGSANYLDDYEEGVVTATLSPDTSGTITLNSINKKLAYTKVGRMVTITGLLVVSSVSSPAGTYVRVLGLPFAVVDLDGHAERTAPTITYFDQNVGTYTVTPALATANVSEFRVYRTPNTWASSDSFYINFSYFTS